MPELQCDDIHLRSTITALLPLYSSALFHMEMELDITRGEKEAASVIAASFPMGEEALHIFQNRRSKL